MKYTMNKRNVVLTLLFFSLFHNTKAQIASSEQLKTLNAKSNGESICFTENSGQVHDQYEHGRPDVLFGGQARGLAFHLRNNGVSYQLCRVDEWKYANQASHGTLKNHRSPQIPKKSTVYRVDVNWLNTNGNSQVIPQLEKEGLSHFYTGMGEFHAKSYGTVTYHNIYDGISLKWYEKDGELKYDYMCDAGSDYKKIQMAVAGAGQLELNAAGELQITTSLGTITEKAPLVIQSGKALGSRWVLKGNILSFEIQGLKKSLPYVIDPAIRAWGTYYGGNAFEGANSCAADAAGNVYITGNTYLNTSAIIATSGSHQSTLAGMDDAYVVKFNSSGVRQWATYYGGSGSDNGVSLAVEVSTGNVYMCGVTSSTNGIATASSHQTLTGGGALTDAFLVKFNSSGVRQWATYYGGNSNDISHSCALDASGNIYMSGTTELTVTASASIIATSGSHQSSFGGGINDAFLVKFNSSGVRQWATFYGGSDIDQGNACTTYSNDVYLSGITSSTNSAISTSSCHQTAYGGGIMDAYLVKFNSGGTRQWATYYGGAGDDMGYSCATDALGNVFMAGPTTTSASGVIATAASHQSVGVTAFDNDGFLVKFSSSGVRQWGTYYGGDDFDDGYDCTTDAQNNVYLVGSTSSTLSSAISTSGSHQTSFGPNFGTNAYMVQFNNNGVRQWGTYYGDGGETGYGCAIDGTGNAFMVGVTSSTSSAIITSSGAHQTSYGGLQDGFLVKFIGCNVATPTNVTSGSNQSICSGNSTTLSATSGTNTISWYASLTATTALGTGTAYITPTLSVGSYTYYAEASGCSTSARAAITVTVSSSPVITVNSATICSGTSVVITPTAAGISSFSITGNNFTVSPSTTTSYSITGSGAGCAASNTAVATVSVNARPTILVNSATICSGSSVVITPTAPGIAAFTITGNNFTVNPTSNTSYSVTGTGTNGCAASNTAVAQVSVNATPSIAVISATICSGNSVAITPTATGITAFTITGNNFTVSPLSNTSYSVTGTGTNGCAASNTAVATVSVKTTPSITVNSATICSGASVVITPTASGITTFSITGNNFTVSPAANSSYSVTGTGTNNCAASNTAVATILVNLSPTITVNNATICTGGSAVISPTAAGVSVFNITGNNFTVSPVSNTSYSVTGTGTNGCPATNTAVAQVSVIAAPSIAVNSATICAGNAVVITPTAAGITSFTITGNNFTVSPTTTTSYSITGSGPSCAATNTAVSTISVNTTPTISVNSATICSGNSIVISPTAAGISVFNITGGNFTVSPVANTSYSVTGTGTNGCAASNTAVASVSVNLTPTIAVNNATICSGASVVITPTATGATAFTITGNTFTVSPVTNATYSVTGTGANGCAASNTAVVSVVVNTSPTISVNSASICSGSNAVVSPSGAATYSITGGSFTVSPATTTSYTITGTGANGCVSQNQAIATITVDQSPTLTVNSGSICAGQTFTINPSGASTYTIQGGSATVSPAVNTTYTVSGTSANGCVAVNVATVNVTLVAAPTISVNGGAICQGQSFTIVPSGATSYTIQGGTAVVSPGVNTSYTVIGASALGCLSQNTATVNLVVNITPDFTVQNVALCKQSWEPQPSAVIQPVGNVTTYTFLGPVVDFVGPSNGASAVVRPSSTTVYTVMAANGNCKAEKTFTVNVGEKSPFVEMGVNGSKDITVCAGNAISLVSEPFGTQFIVTASNYTSTSLSVSPTVSTTYSVVVSNDGYCYSDPLRVNVKVSVPGSYSSFPDTITNLHWPGIQARMWDSIILGFRNYNFAFEYTSAELKCGYQNLFFNSVIPAGRRLRANPFAPPSSTLDYNLSGIGFENAFVETYTVICDTREGCQVTKVLTFKFEAHPFYATPIQNLITPNNDGSNDQWIPSVDYERWEIFNSAGVAVASSRTLRNWDGGLYNRFGKQIQKDAPEGVYTYVIMPDNEKTGSGKVRTGTITLTR